MSAKTHKGWASFGALVVVVALAASLGIAGCGGAEKLTATTAAGAVQRSVSGGSTPAGPSTTCASTATTVGHAGENSFGSVATPSYDSSADGGTDAALAGTLSAIQVSDQKIVTDVQLEIEVENGKFQAAFDKALQLADRYGGYLVSSNSSASGEDQSMKSGIIVLRVPSNSSSQALSDAGRLGKLKNQSLSTQDVTEEYVDLQARVTNSAAHVNALVALLGKAKTVDEILQVQSVLTSAQQELEQLKGRMRYLDEHTTYSTITMSIFEADAEVKTTTAWGVGGAFSAALHNLVRAFNAIVRGLGVLIPVLIVLAIIGYVVYLIVRAIVRGNRQRQQAAYHAYHQGWGTPDGQPAPVDPGATAAPGERLPVAPPPVPTDATSAEAERPATEA